MALVTDDSAKSLPVEPLARVSCRTLERVHGILAGVVSLSKVEAEFRLEWDTMAG